MRHLYALGASVVLLQIGLALFYIFSKCGWSTFLYKDPLLAIMLGYCE